VPGSRIPKLLVVGRNDHLVSVARLAEISEHIDGPVNLDIYEEADHFWADQDRTMARSVADYLCRELTRTPHPTPV
jgi:alpha/beta superfamily hydrolase